MDSNTWAVTLAETDDDYFFAAGAVGDAGPVTLLKSSVGTYGVAYKVTVYSTGDSSGKTWTIVGKGLNGEAITEVLAAANAGTATSTNYFTSVTSMTASAAMTGDQKIGYAGTPVAVLPATLCSVYWVAADTAGTITVNRNSTTGTELLKIHTPAAVGSDSLDCGAIRIRGGTNNDFGVVSLGTVTKVTLIFR